MRNRLNSFVLVFIFVFINNVCPQDMQFAQYFASCKKGAANFDICIRDAINDVRPFFKGGLPEYNVGSFDPFFAEEVTQNRSGLSYKLKLRNVTEAGWTVSRITDFKSDMSNNKVELTHFFPDKRLRGRYEFQANIFGREMFNKGTWTLNLYNYVQKMTVSREPRSENGRLVYDTPIKVDVKLQTCERLELHISDLLGGRRLAERVLDQIINVAWPPGFYLLRPVINDLVSTAFTKIFDEYFRSFPIEQIIT